MKEGVRMDWEIIQMFQVWGKTMALIIGAGALYMLGDWIATRRKSKK